MSQDSPETFEYRNISVRRIHRGAFATGGGLPAGHFAWRARVDAQGKSRSVTANSVADVKEKIDAILDAE